MLHHSRLCCMKIGVLGDQAVGKTSAARAFSGLQFEREYHETKEVKIWDCMLPSAANGEDQIGNDQGTKIRAQFWDCGSQFLDDVRLQRMLDGALCVLLLYDITDMQSYLNATTKWFDCARSWCPDAFLVLIGCKNDLVKHRAVSLEEVESFSAFHNIFFMEMSAQNATNVDLILSILRIRAKHTMNAQSMTNDNPNDLEFFDDYDFPSSQDGPRPFFTLSNQDRYYEHNRGKSTEVVSTATRRRSSSTTSSKSSGKRRDIPVASINLREENSGQHSPSRRTSIRSNISTTSDPENSSPLAPTAATTTHSVNNFPASSSSLFATGGRQQKSTYDQPTLSSESKSISKTGSLGSGESLPQRRQRKGSAGSFRSGNGITDKHRNEPERQEGFTRTASKSEGDDSALTINAILGRPTRSNYDPSTDIPYRSPESSENKEFKENTPYLEHLRNHSSSITSDTTQVSSKADISIIGKRLGGFSFSDIPGLGSDVPPPPPPPPPLGKGGELHLIDDDTSPLVRDDQKSLGSGSFSARTSDNRSHGALYEVTQKEYAQLTEILHDALGVSPGPAKETEEGHGKPVGTETNPASRRLVSNGSDALSELRSASKEYGQRTAQPTIEYDQSFAQDEVPVGGDLESEEVREEENESVDDPTIVVPGGTGVTRMRVHRSGSISVSSPEGTAIRLSKRGERVTTLPSSSSSRAGSSKASAYSNASNKRMDFLWEKKYQRTRARNRTSVGSGNADSSQKKIRPEEMTLHNRPTKSFIRMVEDNQAGSASSQTSQLIDVERDILVDINLEGRKIGTISVHENDDLENLAAEFVQKNHLPLALTGKLSTLLESRVSAYYDELQSASNETSIRRAMSKPDESKANWSSQRWSGGKPRRDSTTSLKSLQDRPILGTLHVKVGKGRVGKLVVREGDDPKELVGSFCKTFGLRTKQANQIEDRIRTQLRLAEEHLGQQYKEESATQNEYEYELENGDIDGFQDGDDAESYVHERFQKGGNPFHSTKPHEQLVPPPIDTAPQGFINSIGHGRLDDLDKLPSPLRYPSVLTQKQRELLHATLGWSREVSRQDEEPKQQNLHQPYRFDKGSMPSNVSMTETEIETNGGNEKPNTAKLIYSPPRRMPPRVPKSHLFNLDVNLGQGRVERIEVHENDDLSILAQDFCAKHRLSPSKVSRIQFLLEEKLVL